MESTLKHSNIDGTEATKSSDGVKVANRRTIRSSDFLLRFLAFAATLVAAILIGVSKQTKTMPIVVVANLPPIDVEVVAKWQYQSSFKYIMASNIIACVYAAVSLVLSVTNRAGTRSLVLTLIILDLLMASLLFSSNGAAGAVGLLGYQGNSHVRWNKVCNTFGFFCRHMAASVAVSTIGAFNYLLLIVLAVFSLHKGSG
ncbi:hypothetical protein GIB67_034501 [Kingdonia uniflora]|uniref:CASP-like protein n=1 Tax=Kingdonia uniflora TaxID=39325 RepID=A0A7J7PB34_9MAGN|nr:hypothetical protein GIB67_034501 [Kingdonia uniflora]